MNKKDLKLIIGCMIFALFAWFFFFVVEKKHEGNKGIVEYREKVILEFDLNKNDIYVFEGTYGLVRLEVKDGEFHVFNVDCPNHDCEQMGWINKDSLFPIVCLPNEIIIYSSAS